MSLVLQGITKRWISVMDQLRRNISLWLDLHYVLQISKDIKNLILKRKIPFNEYDISTMRTLRKEVRAVIKKTKMRYKIILKQK